MYNMENTEREDITTLFFIYKTRMTTSTISSEAFEKKTES